MGRLLTAIVLVACVGTSTPAMAQSSSREYRRTIARALREFNGGRFEEARALFRQAHEMSPNARTSRGVGMASFELRDYPQAESALNEALLSRTQPLTPEQRRETQDLLDQTNTFLGRYLFMIQPSGAELLVDDAEPPPRLDGKVLLPVGEHVVRVSLEGHETLTRRIVVAGGEDEVISLELRALDPETGEPYVAESGESTLVLPGIIVLAAAGAPLFAMLGGVGWLVDRDAEVARCRDVPADQLCLNEDVLASEHSASIGFTVAMGITAALAAGAGLTLLLLGLSESADEEAASIRCTLGMGGIGCSGRF